MTDQNKRFAELAGIDTNLAYTKIHCPNCGYLCTGKSVFCTPPIPVWPDYEHDARLVVEVMRQREDWPEFCEQIGHYDGKRGIERVTVDLMIDCTGKLAVLATEWLERGKG